MHTVTDAVVACILAALLIAGDYQIYFLPQRLPIRPPKSLLIALDNKIPFWSQWAWIYSLLYYPLIAIFADQAVAIMAHVRRAAVRLVNRSCES